MHTYGTPGKFYRYTNLYEINPGGTQKAWYMWSDDPDGDDVHGINLARTDPQLRDADVLSFRRSSRGAATASANRLSRCVGWLASTSPSVLARRLSDPVDRGVVRVALAYSSPTS